MLLLISNMNMLYLLIVWQLTHTEPYVDSVRKQKKDKHQCHQETHQARSSRFPELTPTAHDSQIHSTPPYSDTSFLYMYQTLRRITKAAKGSTCADGTASIDDIFGLE
jgi:hypothetical protein